MAEVISKEELIQYAYGHGWKQEIKDAIEKFPVIETSTIESRWFAGSFFGRANFVCQNCKNFENRPLRYCPVCGAKMADEAVDGEILHYKDNLVWLEGKLFKYTFDEVKSAKDLME